MTHLGPPMMTRGVVEREGNALPTHSGHICALFSIIMHGARLCLVAENGLDQERSKEPPLPGIFLPRHILTMEKISASPIWRRRNALAGHDLCPPVVEEIFCGHRSAYSAPREYSGRNAAREDFLLPSEYFPTRLCIMWMKIFSDPQNENPGEWGAPRPLHASL